MFERAEDQLLHLGKSSAGWCFLLRVYPGRGINDLADWIPLLRGSESLDIYDEYGKSVDFNEMMEIITRRSGNWTDKALTPCNVTCAGPNGLRRYKETVNIRHGAGTWDCVDGDFS